MYFTLLFPVGPGGAHHAYDLVYHPTLNSSPPIWCKKGEELVNNGGPYYQIGYLENLLKKERRIFKKLYGDTWNQYSHTAGCGDHGPIPVRIICHKEGFGKIECLQNIIQDLNNHGFVPVLIIEFTSDGYTLRPILDGGDILRLQGKRR
jgi:hypothetical protein